MPRRRSSSGFTLIELLIVIAVIGIIAALVVPNLLDAMQKAKQKRTMADMKIVGTAMMAWITDQVGAAAAAGITGITVDLTEIPTQTPSEVEAVLVPAYVQRVPTVDAWGAPLDYYLNLADPQAAHVLGVRSPGRDHLSTGDSYAAGPFEPTDYDQDLVWVDGGFIRWPERVGS